jgi:AraC-like DNA-binding protein
LRDPLATVKVVTMIKLRTGVVRHEDDLGRFEHVKCLPSPWLRSVVNGYTGYSHHSSRPLRRREAAQETVALILNFGEPMRVKGPTATFEVDSFVAPLNDTYALTEEGIESHGLQVDLSPLGAYMLLGVPMRELSDLVIPLEDLIGPAVPTLVEQLFLAPGWSKRFELVDSFMSTRMEESHEPSPDVVWAWRRLSETSGRLPIGALAKELGCSRRHLVARFREQVGPSPKTVARIIRFQSAARQFSLDDGRRFAEIAQVCGYFDQAHLNRDCRELAGTTPSSLVASRIPGGFGVTAD